MVKEILIYPKDKDILTQVSEEVKDVSEVQELIQDMKETLHSTEHGVGISAVQFGVLKRVCVIHYNGRDIALINPVITKTRGEVDSKYGVFKRPQKVWCTYIDENGKEQEIADGGFVSRVISHECDHLERRLFSFSHRR